MLVKTYNSPEHPGCTLKIYSAKSAIYEGEDVLACINFPICDGDWERRKKVTEVILEVIATFFPETFNPEYSLYESMYGESDEPIEPVEFEEL